MVPDEVTRHVSVRFGASLRLRSGHTRVRMELSGGATVRDVIERVGRTHPELAGFLPCLLPIVNGCHAEPTQRLGDQDELALLAPVAGG